MKKILPILLILALMIPLASAASKLNVMDLKAYVDGDKDSNVDENGGTIQDVAPESELKVRFEVHNLYTDDEDVKIKNILATATLEDIDDGSDIVLESDKFSLEADQDESITFEFKIPLVVEEDTYDLKIEVEGEDTNDSTDYNIDIDLQVKVEKESSKLKFYDYNFTDHVLICEYNTILNIGLINIGDEDDEEDVELIIRSSRLGIDIRDKFILDGSPSASDNKYENSFPITIPESTVQGTYDFDIRAEFSSRSESQVLQLFVQECTEDADDTDTEDSDTSADDSDEDEDSSDTQDSDTSDTGSVTTSTTTNNQGAQTTTTPVIQPVKQSLFDTSLGDALLIFGEVLIIIIGIAVILVIHKKR